MSGSGLPLHIIQTVTTAARLSAVTKERRLMGFLLFGGSANSSVEFKNNGIDGGTVLLTANALAATSIFVDLTCYGGILFSTAIFCKPAGTGAIVYAWYE